MGNIVFEFAVESAMLIRDSFEHEKSCILPSIKLMHLRVFKEAA
jgi:hypothetical protein